MRSDETANNSEENEDLKEVLLFSEDEKSIIEKNFDAFNELIETDAYTQSSQDILNYKTASLLKKEIMSEITTYLLTLQQCQFSKLKKLHDSLKKAVDNNVEFNLQQAHLPVLQRKVSPHREKIHRTQEKIFNCKHTILKNLQEFQKKIPDYQTKLSTRHDRGTLSFKLWKAIDVFLKLIGQLKEEEKSTYKVRGAKVAKTLRPLNIFEVKIPENKDLNSDDPIQSLASKKPK
jgi:hypothetical protein